MLYQFLPRLADDEYASLEASIREHGIQVPILVDENKSIIDGHHRAEIAERLGIECPRRLAIDLSDEQKRTLALSLNIARRHLNRDQRRRLIASSVLADPHLSNRQHAERTGADHKTVGAVRTQMESTGEIPQSAVRTSADGRVRPATQPTHQTPEPAHGGEAVTGSGQTSGESEAGAPAPEQASSGEAVPSFPPPPAPPVVHGIDGKTYSRPEPKPEPTPEEVAEQDRRESVLRDRDRALSFIRGWSVGTRLIKGEHPHRDEILAALEEPYRDELARIEKEYLA